MKINTKLLMISSAVLLTASGLALTFFPLEIALYFHFPVTTVLFLQLTGAMYFSFGIMNWSIRQGAIGGIYNRPIVMANVTHFLIGSLAFIKYLAKSGDSGSFLLPAIIYALFALLFVIVLFTNPGKAES